MLLCSGCKREMRCEKNGVKALFGHGSVYRGDYWLCSSCGGGVIVTSDKPSFDPNARGDEGVVVCGEEE